MRKDIYMREIALGMMAVMLMGGNVDNVSVFNSWDGRMSYLSVSRVVNCPSGIPKWICSLWNA